ncbi:MAG: M4 family metallopeptidase [Archangium sp.]
MLVLATACQSPQQAPTPQELSALVTTGWAHPEKHQAFARETSTPQSITWRRTFDGIELLAEPRSVLVEGGRWETRFIPELQEPPAVDRSRLLSFQAAAESVGLARELADGTVKARYLYQPQFLERPNKPVVTNAVDVDRFIERYVLTIELVNDPAKVTTVVDAYSAKVLARISHEKPVAETQMTLDAFTMNYGVIQLSMAGKRVNRYTSNFLYKDLERCTTLTPTGTACMNGQGIASPEFLNFMAPIPYDPVALLSQGVDGPQAALSVRNDIYFGLQTSWDYFLNVHDRRGLTNFRQPSVYIWAPNDAVARLCVQGSCSFASSDNNAGMDTGSGQLTLYLLGWDLVDRETVKLSVIGHEWAHGVWAAEVLNHTNPNYFYWGEEGGLNEGNSDFFGKVIEAYGLNRIGQQNDATIRDWYIAGRNMCTPSVDGTSFDEWEPGINLPNQEAHRTSGPVNRAHCLMVRGLKQFGTSPGEPGLQSARVPTAFQGLGTQSVAKIWYATLAKLVNQRPISFVEARDAEVLSAQQLFGVNSLEQKAVEDAWAAVNVGAPAERTPPVVTLLTPGPFKRGDTIEVSATDADGVKSVWFSLDHTAPVVLTAPPWRFDPQNAMVDGFQTLHVFATDNKNNGKMYDFQVFADYLGPALTFSDVTPCAASFNCPMYRLKKKFAVTATDASGVDRVELLVDGAVVATQPGGGSFVFEYTFPVGGVFNVSARGVDVFNNTRVSTAVSVFVDTSPPSIYSGPTVTVSTTDDGKVSWYVCATDFSAPSTMAYTLISVDGVAISTNNLVSGNGTCVTASGGPIAGGSHTYSVRVQDKWENRAVVNGTFTVVRIPIQMTTPLVTVDAVNIGRIVVTTKITAQLGTKSITWWVDVTQPIQTFPASASDNQTTYTQVFSGLAPGSTHTVNVFVEGNNGTVLQLVSAPFTIPMNAPPPPTSFAEVERNDETPNTLQSTITRVTGTYNGTPLPGLTGFWDFDGFELSVSAGRNLRVTSALNCAYASVELRAYDPNDDSWSVLSRKVANGSVLIEWPAFPANYGGPHTLFEIGVSYNQNFNGWGSTVTPGCSSPGYTLNLSTF